jgi:hypothetical protein
MNRFAACGDPRADDQGRNDRLVQIGPKGSRHQRMLWAARKIARLTGVTEGGAYKMLLSALIEAERGGPIPGFSMTADE